MPAFHFTLKLNLYFKLFLKTVRNTLTMPFACEISVSLMNQNWQNAILMFLKDYLVWTDQNDMNGIHMADIQTQNKIRGILHPQTGQALDVIAYDVLNQPILDGD